MSVDIAALPDIEFCETDTAAIELAIITTYEGVSGTTLYPGDPVRLFLESLSLMISQERQVINQAAKRNLVSSADKGFLDHLGVFQAAERLGETFAVTTLRFTISAAQEGAVSIPIGTRATPDNALMFATTAVGTIAAGDLTVDVAAQCATAGEEGNGYVPGQINKLVDQVGSGAAYVVAVTNVTESDGGAGEEDDDDYRVRIAEAPRSYSVAGPGPAYKWWAMTASSEIIDVSYTSPEPGEVVLCPLMAGGALPGEEMLAAVLAIVGAKGIRPDTDSVTVSAPGTVAYIVTASYWISSSDAEELTTIQAAVEGAYAEWITWQRSALGRTIDPSELVYRLKAAGASQVSVALPARTTIDEDEIAVADEENSSLTYEGLADG